MKCPVCGKQFDVLWPNQWAYKRNNVYICSYGCMQMLDQRKEDRPMNNKLTKEQHAEAVRIALAGGNVKQFLKECGSKNPDSLWCYLKKKLMVNDPETYEKLANGVNVPPMKPGAPKPPVSLGDTMAGMKQAADNFFGACEDMGLNLEVPEPVDGGPWEKMETPEEPATKDTEGPPFEYKVTGIVTAVGMFNYFRKTGYLDWTDLNGETVSMNLEEWKEFLKVLPEAMKVLGVEL